VKAAEQYIKWGAKEIILTHNKELLVAPRAANWAAPSRTGTSRAERAGRQRDDVVRARALGSKPARRSGSRGAHVLEDGDAGAVQGHRADVDAYLKQSIDARRSSIVHDSHSIPFLFPRST